MNNNESNLPVLRIPRESIRLRDNDQWQHRFEIRSESSDRIYVVAQHKARKYWGCSCPSWKSRKRCKHLIAIDLPTNMRPHEVQLEEAK
ncbi:MAG: SWIM zinc finger family protein [Acidobacteria bacterium]|nr:SWIM zinc finger family protein [Acidobacteriota bacterium]